MIYTSVIHYKDWQEEYNKPIPVRHTIGRPPALPNEFIFSKELTNIMELWYTPDIASLVINTDATIIHILE